VLVSDPHDMEMLSALGLVLLLFCLGLEFHLDDLRSGGRRMAPAGGTYLALNVGAGLGFGFALAVHRGVCALRPPAALNALVLKRLEGCE
jgi:Kef-type K+ transport system membrane component KefB